MPKLHKLPSGFTIVELLIVIVVIAILAAITVVAYNGIQQRSRVTVIKSDLDSLGKKLMLYYAENDSYPSNNTQMKSLGWQASFGSYQQNNGGNLLYCAITSGAGAKFTVAARTSDNSAFIYSSGQGIQQYTGAWSGAWSIDCPIYGFTTSDPNFKDSQGYHPPTWGSPGLKVWAGGTVDAM